jgi:hypothetical protein
VLIPGEYYKEGVSLSPRPVEGEEEEARKNKVRRWMVGCKVSEWVLLYSHINSDYPRKGNCGDRKQCRIEVNIIVFLRLTGTMLLFYI